MRTRMVARYSSPWLTSGLWLNRIQETSPHCSLIPISSFLFCLKLVTILNSFPRFYSLYTPWERGWLRTVLASFGFAMPNDSWGSWVPACRTGTITLITRFFKRTKNEAGVERETRATIEGVCHAYVSRPPHSSHKKKCLPFTSRQSVTHWTPQRDSTASTRTQWVACEQALLFGRAKRVSRERARERQSREEQRPLARAFSRGSLRPPKQESLLAGYIVGYLPTHLPVLLFLNPVLQMHS